MDYFIRLKRQYDVPITQVVIFLQETEDEIAFAEEYVDEATIHRYRVIRMWEQDPALFLNNDIASMFANYPASGCNPAIEFVDIAILFEL